MAYFGNSIRYKTKSNPPITMGDGENQSVTSFEIKQSESSHSRNTSSRNYPAFSVKPGRSSAFSFVTKCNAFGVYNNTYPHIVDGTTWKRWDGSAWQTVVSSLTDAKGKFIEFVTEAKRYMVYFNGTDKKAWDGTTVTTLSNAPATKLITVDDYRLYALLGTTLKCSAEADITTWVSSMNADSISITSALGQGTALTAVNDIVIAWTEQSMHTLYGNDPYDFEFGSDYDDGCISDKSVITFNGRAYFLDFGAYKEFAGGKPIEVSQKVRKYLEGINLTYKSLCTAGKHGRYIYLSIPYGTVTVNNITLEYDTELGNWYVWDEGYTDFINIGESLYGVDTAGAIWLMNTGSHTGTWEHITGVWNNGLDKFTLSKLNMIVDLLTGSTLTVSYSITVDGEDFVTLYTGISSNTTQNAEIIVPLTTLQNIDFYRLKFSGTGPCTIHYVRQEGRIRA